MSRGRDAGTRVGNEADASSHETPHSQVAAAAAALRAAEPGTMIVELVEVEGELRVVRTQDLPDELWEIIEAPEGPERARPRRFFGGTVAATCGWSEGRSRRRRGCRADNPRWGRRRKARTRPSPRPIRAGATTSPARGDAVAADADRPRARTGLRRGQEAASGKRQQDGPSRAKRRRDGPSRARDGPSRARAG